MKAITVRDRQSACPVDLAFLKRIIRVLLLEKLELRQFDLGVYLLSAAEMERLNSEHLGHDGPTDVITFDYGSNASEGLVHGELLLCPEVALDQAIQFHTTWEEEIVRYVVHGILHLLGFDDRYAACRRIMKTREDQLVRQLSDQFDLAHLARKSSHARKH